MFRTVIPLGLLAAVVTSSALAQVENPLQTNVPVSAFSSARSSVFNLSQGDQLVVRATGPDALDVRMSVFTSDSDIVASEDPEVARADFEYLVPKDGGYYVVGRNVSGVDGSYSVYIRQGAKVETPAGKPLAIVRIFYATNRTPANRMDRAPYYLNEPSNKDIYSVGTCDIRIPRNHKLGELESASMLRFDFAGNAETGIRIESVHPESDLNKFFAAVGDKAKQTADQQVLVFVHGFNVSFEDAARRLGQMSYDLAFAGAPILFSWPSHNEATQYEDDGKRAAASVKIMKSFLTDLAAKTGAKTINLMAHSMGNRVLTQALEQLSAEANAPRFRNAILVAPDVDASELKRIAQKIHVTSSRVTLYTSSKDLALKLSELKGNLPRAGNHILLTANLETIDATAAATELSSWSHSYFGDSPIVLGDLFHLLRGEPPDLRFALDRICPDGDCAGGKLYWRFRPTAR